MADTEKKVVFTVNTGNSEKTVKGLKEEIRSLQDTILNLDRSTDEYASAVAKLQEDQRALNEVMSLTRRDAVALEGSYDALTYRMAELKKEWKATNDEARRNELGRQIDDINTQLKELDASTGNYQRNVGNYTEGVVDAFAKLKQEIKDARNELLNAEEGTEEYNKAMQRLSDAQFQLRDMNEQSRYAVADFGEQLSNVAGITSGIVSGFSALQAVMVLTGNDTEDFQKVMVKLQATMALVQGLQGLEGVIDRVKGLGKALTTVMKSMGKAGWIGLILTAVVALGTLVHRLAKQRQALNDVNAAQKEYNKTVGEAYKEELKSVAQEIALLETLYRLATDTSINGAYKQREKAAKALLEQLGIEANQLNINAVMQEKYAEKQDNVNSTTFTFAKAVYQATDALKQQAKAAAVLDFITKKYEEILQAEWNIVQAQKEGVTSGDRWNAFWVQMSKLRTGTFAVDFVNGADMMSDRIEGMKEDVKGMYEDIDKYLQEMVSSLDMNSLLNELTKETKKSYAELADEEITALDSIYNRRVEYARMSNKTEQEKERDIYFISLEWSNKRKEIINDYLAKAKEVPVELDSVKSLTDRLLNEELDAAKLVYDEKKRLADAEKQVKENLLKNTEEYYKKQNDALEHHRDMMLGWNEISIKSDEEKAEESYMINQKYWQERVKLLEENLAVLMSDEIANADAIIELEREKSEAILQIETDRYNELERLRAERREKEKKELEGSDWESSLKLRRNAISDDVNTDDDDNTKAERAYQIQKESLEKRLSLLKEYEANALKDGDTDARLEYQRQIAETEVEIEEAKYAELERLRDANLQSQQEKLDQWMGYFDKAQAGLDTLANVMDAVYANMQANAEENGEISEGEARRLKGIQIAQTWISTLSGAVQAFAGAMQLGPIAGPIVGGINAAAMIAMGIANTKQIQNTDFTGNVNTGGTTAPQPSTYQSDLPFNYTRQVTGVKEADELNRDTRVYVVESDITEAQNASKVRVQESTF